MAKKAKEVQEKPKREKSPKGEKKIPVAVNLTKDMKAKLEAVSKEQGISMSQLIVNILTKSSVLK